MAKSSSNVNSRSTGAIELSMFKNKLQEYTQKLGLPFPAYRTSNEGFQHAPQFRSTVFVEGAEYTSKVTFRRLKEAEQDAAKLAYECIMSNAEQSGVKPLLDQDPKSSKLILHELAFKRHWEMPTYKTCLSADGSLPVYVSAVTVGGQTFTSGGAKSKKEAEQFAARAAIQSLLGTDSRVTSNEVMNMKKKHYGTPVKVKVSEFTRNKFSNASYQLGLGSPLKWKSSVQQLTSAPHSSSGTTQSLGGRKRVVQDINLSGKGKLQRHI